jgi:hypothetical protein
MSDIGFVYVLHNPAMDHLFKIGYTLRSPHARAQEISAPTGIPVPFEVVMYWEVEDPSTIEAEIHLMLGEFRASKDREFFHCDLEFIIDTFRQVADPYAEYMNALYSLRANPTNPELLEVAA